MARVLKHLPTAVSLWSPDDVAAFLRSKGQMEAAQRVEKSVRLHSFDEVDGPRVLRYGMKGLQSLGVPSKEAETLWSEMAEVGKAHRFEGKVPKDGIRDRCEAALWGIFIADALSAPAHWYYDTAALMADYGTIRGYVAPKKKNSANRIMNNHWKANKHDICTLVDGGHMLHGKGRVWKEPYNHYHDSFQPGENTLNAQIARVLMRNMTMAKGRYDHEAFLQDYKAFLTTAGSHNDSYAEAFHRQLMANHLLRGLPLDQSAGAENHDTPSIGGFVGLLPLLILASSQDCDTALATAERHLSLTHKSQRLSSNLSVYARCLWSVLMGIDLREATAAAAFELGWDLPSLVAEGMNDHDVIYRIMGPACYIGDSLPVVLYLAYTSATRASTDAFREAVLANTNLGGENCHRGSVLGFLLGAAYGMEGIPAELLEGLYKKDAIRKEVNEFLDQIF